MPKSRILRASMTIEYDKTPVSLPLYRRLRRLATAALPRATAEAPR